VIVQLSSIRSGLKLDVNEQENPDMAVIVENAAKPSRLVSGGSKEYSSMTA
jgi:hypothetical protein